MTFRDDRDALRAKSEAAEAEANALRRRLEETERELAAHEEKDVKDESELARLREELAGLRGRAQPKPKSDADRERRRVQVVVGIVAASVVAGVVAVVLAGEGSKTEGPAPAPAVVATPPDPPRAPSPLDVAIFGAQVISSVDAPAVNDQGCAVEAEIVQGPSVGRVRFFCGADAPIYDSTTSAGVEMTMHSENVVEHARGTGEFVYRVSYQDTGTRTGERPQMSFDSETHMGRVWRDGATPFDLRFFLDDRSAVRGDTALGPSPRQDSGADPMHRAAEATDHQGTLPTSMDACEVLLHANAGSFPCRLTLRCGRTIVYGAGTSGYGECMPSIGLVASMDDPRADDGDPILHFDGPGDRLVVSAEGWQSSLQIENDTRCHLSGSWSGRARRASGETSLSFGARTIGATSVRVNGRLVSNQTIAGPPSIAAAGLPSGEAQVELDCARGTGTIALSNARYVGQFGPGFATFLGHVEGSEPALFWMRRDPQSEEASALPPEAAEAIRALAR